MGLQPQKTIVNTGIPVFQDVEDTAQGGFVLDATGLPAGGTIPAGTPMGFDETTRKAKPVKLAELFANAANNATTYQVKKGHLLVVGDIVTAVAGGAAHTITAIDTTASDHDVVTLDVTLGVALNGGAAALAGDVLFQSSAAGANAGALSVTPRGLSFSDKDIAAGVDLAVVLVGRVYERRVPKPGAAIKALMPNIIYSQSL